MLPLLPALILLLLQGPAGIQRMASNGQLPGALDALHRQIARSPESTRSADEVVLASLLAVSGDKTMSRALMQLLVCIQPDEPKKATTVREESPPVAIPPSLGTPQDGYLDGRLSRDGPLSIA